MPTQSAIPRLDEPPGFTIEAASEPDTYVIRIAGELDLASRSELELALKEAERSQAERIVLDLEQLTFIDCPGLGAIVEASRRSASAGNRLQMTRGRGLVARVFRLAGLDNGDLLPLTEACPYPAVRDSDQSRGPVDARVPVAPLPLAPLLDLR